MATKKKNYLNNKDILKEIHKSKMSYCYVMDDTFFDYDAIVSFGDSITADTIEEAKKGKASRLSLQKFNEHLESDPKSTRKASEFAISPDSISKDDVTIRIMTFDHIPLAKRKKKTISREADHYTRCNFPPFIHVSTMNTVPQGHSTVVDEIGDQWVEVARSHWKGDLTDGGFDVKNGNLTDKLARMMVMLCHRYSMQSNWRGYCVDEETSALTTRGWLNHDEISEDDMILSFFNNELVWSKIHSIYRDNNYNGPMHHITNKQGLNMLITPAHKLVTSEGLVRVEHVIKKDKVILMGEAVQDDESSYSDDLVELVGWVVTEGCYEYNNKGIKAIRIYQNEGEYAERIRNCLGNLNYSFHESSRGKCVCFYIHKNDSIKLETVAPKKELTPSFITSISTNQRELLLKTLIDGDGHRTGELMRYTQKDRQHCDAFQMLCALLGRRSQSHDCVIESFGKETSITRINVFSKIKNRTNAENLDFNGGYRTNKGLIGKKKIDFPNVPTSEYQGTVWCPETEYGSFIAKRNGSVYLTGNSYVDEMQSSALEHLVKIGLQFDESKGQNPFAYYTTSLLRSFRRVFNIEKKNQNIRDDLLQESGQMPSFTRQLDHELSIIADREESLNEDDTSFQDDDNA